MKITAVLFSTLATIATIHAAATPSIDPLVVRDFCNSPGESCYELKRAVAAIAEPIALELREAKGPKGKPTLPTATAQNPQHFCYRPGEPCSKAKRALDELRDMAEEL